MAFPRFAYVKNDFDKTACVNIESIMSIEEVSSDPAHEDCVLITLSNGKEFYFEVDNADLLVKNRGDKVVTAVDMMEREWVCCADCSTDRKAYVDEVDATLFECDTIPVVVQNPGEFHS